MWADDDKPHDPHPTAGRVAAWELRRRLLKAGLSQWEPDPVAALEAVAARQRDEVGEAGASATDEQFSVEHSARPPV
jgi:hypothetical protein